MVAMAQRSDRFYSLDVMRGIAALCVVFYHWQSFSTVGTVLPASFVQSSQPLYVLFAPLYRFGYLAVDLFFSLSGFIFFMLYSARVSNRTISPREFFVLRLSRLYPLHLATLCFVAVAQALMMNRTHAYFALRCNDIYHFVLNLMFASSWGLEKDRSFNGPFWSVSVEALLYIIFFAVCRARKVDAWETLVMCAIGAAIWPVYGPVGHGIFSFFLGGGVFLLYRRTLQNPPASKYLALVIALWLIPLAAAIVPALARLPLFVPAASMYMRALVFPATIYALAVHETRRGTFGRRLAVLGDISYGLYLIHFPLQLLLALLATLLGISFGIFQSPYVLAAFFALLLSISYVSHRHFEMPMQRWMRRRWLRSAEPRDLPKPETKYA